MNRLLKYLKDYKKECVLAPLFKMLEALFELTVPLVIAQMIDRGIGNSDTSFVYIAFGILIALGFIGLLVSCTAQYFAAKAATGFSKDLRHDLFSHIMSFSFTEIDNVGTSTMITRMTSDVNILQNGVNMFLRLFLRSPFIVAGAMIMAFTIDVKSALVFVAVIFCLAIAVFVIMNTNIPLLKKSQQKLDEVLRLVRENLSGARVVRAFTLEDSQTEEFREKNTRLTSFQLKAGKISGLLNPLTYVMINIAIVILIVIGEDQNAAGVLTKGQIVALYNYMSQILIELIKFANLIVTLNKSFASAIRVNEIFDVSPSMKEATDMDAVPSPEKDAPAVEYIDVSLKYHELSDEAVSDISFVIEPGKTFGIIGGTGSGKTTVASMIPRFYDATKGIIKIFGRDVRDYPLDFVRKNVGIVMQHATLFEGSIRDNLQWADPDASDEDILNACETAVCSEVVRDKGGLDAMIEAGGRNLSGGQRQRLCIARVLVGKPSILILDDSASALDYMTDQRLRENISKLSYDPTVIIIAQRAISVQKCDSILVLDDGQCVGLGSHEELLTSCAVYREIYESQYGKED